jgi:hypothetical protein
MILMLAKVRGVGIETADLLVHECRRVTCATTGQWGVMAG